MGLWDDASGWVSQNMMGNVDPEVLKKLLAGVQGPTQSAYQIPGMADYTGQMQGLGKQTAGTSVDLAGATAQPMQQSQQLGDYFQSIATGNGTTAADQMLQNAQGTAGRQLQSQAVGMQGMSPALALRQMLNSQAAVQGNIAGQSAQQKLQEQEQYGQLAQQNANSRYQQQFQNAQQDYQNKMGNMKAQADIANGIFSADRAQGSLNVSYDQNKQAFQQFQYQQQRQIAEDEARSKAALMSMLVKGGLAVGGAALTGGMSSMFGGVAGSAAGGAITGGLSSFGSDNGGGSGGFVDPSLNTYTPEYQGASGNPFFQNGGGGPKFGGQ